jgi:hypothetical protein
MFRLRLFSGAQLGFNSSRKLRAGKKPRAAVSVDSTVTFDPHVSGIAFGGDEERGEE